MKKRLEQLLNGKFTYSRPGVVLTPDRIDRAAARGEVLRGTLRAVRADGRRVHGFLYASDPRITFDPPEFNSNNAEIHYQIDTNGLEEGDVCEGTLTVCTDVGEFALPVRAQILEADEDDQGSGEPMTKEAFAQLAQTDFLSAYPLFVSEKFERTAASWGTEAEVLYRALKVNSFSYQSLEEFLIGTHCKDPVALTVPVTVVSFDNLRRSVRESIRIRKSGWGFLRMDIQTDTRFLRPEKKIVTTDEFVGSEFDLDYIIDTNFLHAGKNYGRIFITTCYQKFEIEVLVTQRTAGESAKAARVQTMVRRKCTEVYLDYRLGRIEQQVWIDRTRSLIESYRHAGGRDVIAELFMTGLLFLEDKRTAGRRMLQDIERRPQRIDTPERYGIYLFVSALGQNDPDYVRSVTEKVRQTLAANPDCWVLEWVLLMLDESLERDMVSRIEAVSRQTALGCASPILYLEAFLVFRDAPYLLHRLGSFEQKILIFAARRRLMTPELTEQVCSLALHLRKYNSLVCRLLTLCWNDSPTDSCLTAICTQLIAGDRKDPSCFRWYSLAVNRDLKITGLYEYYMEAMEDCGIERMPQVIRMYFIYNTTLDWRKRARIYRDISDNREYVPQVYRNYRGAIEQFLLEQLELGRIDENLAVLYERFLDRRMLTPALASHLVKILFTFEVTCRNPSIRSIAVVHRMTEGEQVTTLTDGHAQVQIYTEDARILMQDENGNWYASTDLYMAERLLDTPKLLRWCLEIVPEHPGLAVFMCGSLADDAPLTKETLPFFIRACGMDLFTPEYRNDFRRRVLGFYADDPGRDDLFSYLRGIDYPTFVRADKKTLLVLLTQEGMYEEAFGLIETYGSEKVPLMTLVRICSQTVLGMEYEENRVLLSYCAQCYRFGKYDNNILTYLLMYFDGPVEEMKRLWHTARRFELDTMVLEEKILTMMLFTGSGSAGTEQIFLSYREKMGRRKLCRAYLNLKCYEYFVRDMPVSGALFECVESMLEQKKETEDVCRLALLRYYSKQDTLDADQTRRAAMLLSEFAGRGMRFAFFTKFPRELRLPYQLEDKTFLEYAADPAHTMVLHYRFTGVSKEWTQEVMQDRFEGIFVREFILFEGDELECWAEEKDGERVVQVSDRRRVTYSAGDGEEGRYALLNRMIRAHDGGDDEETARQIENYRQLDYVTEHLFTLL